MSINSNQNVISNNSKFEEVELTMPSGQIIAGKWFGNKAIRPILCLHGIEDNCGTFDRLIPLLPRKFSYLALDLPGHGRSSWIPHGQCYSITDFLLEIDFVYKYYKWDKVTFLTHSISSRLAFLYACMYPERVDMMIFIDVLKPSVLSKRALKEYFNESYERFLVTDKRNRENVEPPAYTLEEMTEKIVKGTKQSVTKETAIYLLKRNILPSKKYPGKYYFSRDRRLQSKLGVNIPQDLQLELAEILTMPIIFIEVSKSTYATPSRSKYENEVLEVMKQHPLFQHYLVDSESHHVHLTEPEKIVPVINEFFDKHGYAKSHL